MIQASGSKARRRAAPRQDRIAREDFGRRTNSRGIVEVRPLRRRRRSGFVAFAGGMLGIDVNCVGLHRAADVEDVAHLRSSSASSGEASDQPSARAGR